MKLMVIDVQKGITDEELYNYESFLENVKKLIATARKNQVEIIYFQHDDGPDSGFSVGDEAFEISEEVEKEFMEFILDQAENRRHAEKAVMAYLLDKVF